MQKVSPVNCVRPVSVLYCSICSFVTVDSPLCVDIDECNSDPCQNDGTCVDQVDGFMCQCQDGYAGDMCDISKDVRKWLYHN